jgi:hypothetical protein
MLITLMLSACVSTGPPATPSEKDTAMRSWLSCLRDGANQDDDHKSDAMSIAVAIKARCHSLFIASIEAFSRGMTYRAATMMEDRVVNSDQELGTATDVVLRERDIRQNTDSGVHS